jgi:hypothetical protein
MWSRCTFPQHGSQATSSGSTPRRLLTSPGSSRLEAASPPEPAPHRGSPSCGAPLGVVAWPQNGGLTRCQRGRDEAVRPHTDPEALLGFHARVVPGRPPAGLRAQLQRRARLPRTAQPAAPLQTAAHVRGAGKRRPAPPPSAAAQRRVHQRLALTGASATCVRHLGRPRSVAPASQTSETALKEASSRRHLSLRTIPGSPADMRAECSSPRWGHSLPASWASALTLAERAPLAST